MRFGKVPTSESPGAILAHSQFADGRKIRKGRLIDQEDAESLERAGVTEVTVARLEEGDVGEDDAAEAVATALIGNSRELTAAAPFTGRVNLYSRSPGLLDINVAALNALNRVDPAITAATLPQFSRLGTRALVATVKIITYAVNRTQLDKACERARGALSVKGVVHDRADLIITEQPGQSPKLARKGRSVTEARLERLGITLGRSTTLPHETDAIADALRRSSSPLQLILTGAATSDPHDIGPEGLRRAGGTLLRFGMPVDPGNLLFLGMLGRHTVIGLPGCARSLAANGTDWVLERVACGFDPAGIDIAGMGIGGLLKEVPVRPHPRSARSRQARRPRIEAIALCIDSGSWSERALQALASSRVDSATLVVSHDAATSKDNWHERLSGSRQVRILGAESGNELSLALSVLPDRTDAVLLVGAGDASCTTRLFDRIVASFSPDDGREICITDGADSYGMPALLGRRFFESLAAMRNQSGLIELIRDSEQFLVEIER